jgi:hypothetical protein
MGTIFSSNDDMFCAAMHTSEFDAPLAAYDGFGTSCCLTH